MLELLKHKEFIEGVALHGLSPNHDNTILKDVLSIYNLIDPTVSVVAYCSTCDRPYEKSFKIILAYCLNENWFEEDKKQPTKKK